MSTDRTSEIFAALRTVAPEVDPSQVDPTLPLGEQLDIDSMDLLNFFIALGQRHGIDIAEVDMAHLRSVDDIAAYLTERVPDH